ncbi:uncharacterized protein TNCV_2548791 [Trichonephila clavipes]|nr:uncharacterized protein TNCV_2548791 [Trichonephila clavipes]
MTPVDLPYVPILLNETFITALWDTGAEKSFISEEVYRKYFSYRPRQKTKDKVVTAQGAPCCHLGRVELQIRIPKDIEKTEFITRNGTFAFLRMPFGLSGAAPNFQKAIDIILKPVIGHFVSVYMDDVIITSPSFNEQLDHLNQKGKRVTVNSDQVRVYRPQQSDTISSDSHLETLYEGQRSSNRSSRSEPGKFKGSRKTSSEERNGHKSSKGNAGWEDPILKRKIRVKWIRGQEGFKGSQSIAGPSHQQDSRQDKPPTEGSRHEGSGQYNKARETKTTKNGTNRAAERRPVRSKQATAVRPCPYYLRSRVRQPEGFPEERRNIGIDSIPQNNIRRRSLSMEALDGDPVDRSE